MAHDFQREMFKERARAEKAEALLKSVRAARWGCVCGRIEHESDCLVVVLGQQNPMSAKR